MLPINVVVMEITNITNEALERYYNALSKLGYMNYNNVNSLILLTFIEELLTSDLSYFINEKDYKIITNVINCLYGSSCLIDFPLYETYDNLIHENKIKFMPRITEDSILRITEDKDIRIKA